MDHPEHEQSDQTESPSPALLADGPVLLCYGVAALWLAGGVFGTLAGAVWLFQARPPIWLIPLFLGGGLLLTLSGSAVFWSVGLMIVRQKKILRAIRSLHHARPRGAEPSAGPDESIARQLREIRDVLLMSPEQQQIRRMQLQSGQVQQLTDRFDTAMHRGDFQHARQILDQIQRAQPDNDRLPAMLADLEAASRSAKKADLESARSRVSGFLSAGQFDQARDQARSIIGKYPDEPLGSQLLTDIDAQQQQIQSEQIRRQYRAVDRLAEDRQWSQAVAEARKFLAAWPESKEADLVRATLPTLEDNARLAEVRRLRDKIRHQIGRKEYAEALALARKVVEQYPETAAARELASQMDRLQQRAEQQDNRK